VRGPLASGYRLRVATVTFGMTSTEDVVDVAVGQDSQSRFVRRPPLLGRFAVWIPAVLVLCLGLIGLDRHSVWRDEAASLVAARRSLPELWTMLRQIETVHAVYYTFLHGWLELGTGEVWARVPSVLAMAAAAGLVGVIGSRVVSRPVGLVAGLLFAVNPSVSYYAQEARSTALVAMFALLATWFLLQAVERRSTWWAAYAGACTILVGLNLLALLVPLAHLLTLVVWRNRRRVLVAWAVAGAPALLVAAVLLVVSSQQPFQIGWIPSPGTASVRDFAHLALGPNLPTIVLVALLVLLGIVGSRTRPERRLLALALPLATLPSAALLAMSVVQPIFVSRYVFPSVAAVALLAALGVVRLGRLVGRTGVRALAPVAVLAVLVVAAAGVGTQRLDRTAASRPDDLAGAARVVAAGARPGDAMLFLPSNRRMVALVYPAQFRGLRDVGLGDGPVAAGNLTGRSLSLAETLRNLSTSQRVWAIGRPDLAVLPSEAGARAELAMLDRDFVAVDRTGAHGVGITLYVKRPAAGS
jgi:mannosyltransferase